MINRIVTFITALISLMAIFLIASIFGDFLIAIAIVFPILISIVIGYQVQIIHQLKK